MTKYGVELGPRTHWDTHLPAPIDATAYTGNYTVNSYMDTKNPTWLNYEISGGTDIVKGNIDEFRNTWKRTLIVGDSWKYGNRVELNFYVNGNRYRIPDIWMVTDDIGYGTRFYSNWRTYSGIQCWKSGQSTTVYAWRDGDSSKPWALKMFTAKETNSDQVFIDFDEVAPIFTKGEAPTFDLEFDYKLARKRLDGKWTYKISTLLPGVSDNEYIVCKPLDGSTLNASFVLSQPDGNSQQKPEYMAKAVLKNETETPLVMKSSDYAIAYADSIAVASTFTYHFGLKLNVKFKAGIPVIAENETFIQFESDWTWAYSETTTHTETRTYTIPGQLMTIPPQTTIQVDTAWNRVMQAGKLRTFCDITDSANLSVTSSTATRNVTGSWRKLAPSLGMTSVLIDPVVQKLPHSGVFAYADLNFTSSTGTVGMVTAKEVE